MTDIIIPSDCWDDDSEGAISAWFYAAGETVAAGDVVCEVMNEKVSSEIIATASGGLEILVDAEIPVTKGTVIGRITP